MIEKFDHYPVPDIHTVIEKINEIIDFLNDTYLMKQKDGQWGLATDVVSGVVTDCSIDTTSNLSGDCGVIRMSSDTKCPHCGESYFTEVYSMSTAVYHPPIWKDGVNINPDRNERTTHCRCLKCNKEFDI